MSQQYARPMSGQRRFGIALLLIGSIIAFLFFLQAHTLQLRADAENFSQTPRSTLDILNGGSGATSDASLLGALHRAQVIEGVSAVAALVGMLLIVTGGKKPVDDFRASEAARRPCPVCAESIAMQAKQCRFCRSAVAPNG